MVRWGMVGTGDVTEVKSGPAFSLCAGSTLHAVYNRTHAKAVDYARRHNVPVVHESLEALLEDSEVDAIYVATPPATHKNLALKVIASGKPLCLEKPMAMNSRECAEIIEAAKAKDSPVYVTYYRRSMEKFLCIKQILEKGTIGPLGSVQVTQYQPLPEEVRQGTIPWRLDPAVSGGGILVDMGSHVFDILDFLIGKISSISGAAVNRGGYHAAEDVTCCSFLFENEVVGSAVFNFNTDKWLDRIEVAGELGRIRFSCFDDTPVELQIGGAVEKLEFTPPSPVYLPFVQDMVQKIEQGDTAGYVATAMRPTVLIDQLLATQKK